MSGLNRSARQFLDEYGGQVAEATAAAEIARLAVEQAVRETGALAHVTARAKTIASLRGKLRRKSYKRPRGKLTDLVGVRVITFYRDAVDQIVPKLQQTFEINVRESTDKRLILGLRDFGYRSVHLIARFRPTQIATPNHGFLRKHWFEIQVRSILEHAWAEIEHEIVYKSGIKQPGDVTRRFASLAGTLELLDGEFLALRNENDALIGRYRVEYQKKRDLRKSFDVARLLGFLEATRAGRSWRQAAADGHPFAAGLDASCVEALKAVGLGTPTSLSRMFGSPRYRYALRSFAASQGLGLADVSHFAGIVLAVVIKDARVVQYHFPEIINDPAMQQFFERRTNRPTRSING
jgi:ppGpp synthetase/RelA/SpoT-type nucleotidyltranferase